MSEPSAGDMILELLSTVIQMAFTLQNTQGEERVEILNIAIEALQSIETSLKIHYALSIHAANMALNATESIRRVLKLIEKRQGEMAMDRFQWETLPILMHLQNELEYWIIIRGNDAAGQAVLVRQKRELEDYAIQIERILNCEYAFDVTITVLSYNKFEYTKLCLESIYQYTDLEGICAEIITIDNGSSDETSAFIDSLPHKKKIRLEYNAGPSVAILGTYASEGRYTAFFNNDIIATPRWLENLLYCMKSDTKNVMVAPVLNSISNLQSIPVNYANPLHDQMEMQAFADNYNNSNPYKWEERVRILPSIALLVTKIWAKFPGDPRYYDGFYGDDDMSTLFRRAGLKQLLAKDTFMHHFGSVTLHADSTLSDKYARMRRIFYDKWGVDAWEGMDFNMPIVQAATQSITHNPIRMLAIDPNFGSTALQIKNEFKKKTITVSEMCAVVTDLRYLDDAVGIFDRCETGTLVDALANGIKSGYEIILFHRYIEEYIDESLHVVLQLLKKSLAPSGRVFFSVANPQYFQNAFSLINGVFNGVSFDVPLVVSYTSVSELRRLVEKNGFQATVIPVTDTSIDQSQISMLTPLLKKEINRDVLKIKEFLFMLTVL